MGICASCLGRRQTESYDEDDMSRLLDDPNSIQYGSFGEHNMNSHADPMESQRETEALNRVVVRLTNNLVDVFEIAPQGSADDQGTPAGGYSGQDMRLARYHSILAKLRPEGEAAEAEEEDGTTEAADLASGAEWLPNEDDMADLDASPPVIKEGRGPLVGTFADAATAVA